MSIESNYKHVLNNIKLACERVGRRPEEVTLITVSKTQNQDRMNEAYQGGIRVFGENKVQELVEKVDYLPNDIQMHMIGHLQSNKVKQVVGKVCLIHSVDSLKLASIIDKESKKRDVVSDVLIEVNVGEEDSKFGFSVNSVIDIMDEIATFSNIRVKGLMTIAPFVDNSEENRTIFKVLRELSVDINNKNIDNISMNVLSMGMTNDYMVAIEEGATMVRVGTGIFGSRNY